MQEVSGATFGRYEVLRPIGHGGMAQVYLGIRGGVGGFKKRIVLKILQAKFLEEEEYVQMFLDEARLLAHLHHPNIVDVFEVDCVEGVPFLAMEYVNGPTLGHLHRHAVRSGLANLGYFLHLMYQVCEGLHYAHRLTIDGKSAALVHRDISSQNIVIDAATGTAKIIDFGVAKTDEKMSQTQVGVLKGRIHYMAPEVLRGQKPDARADIYAVGVLLYRLATNQMPFDEGEDIWATRISGKYRPPREVMPDLPEDVERIIVRALEPDPDRRYLTAADVASDLQEVLDQLGVDQRQLPEWIAKVFPGGEDEWQKRFEGAGTASTMHLSLGRLITEERTRTNAAIAAPPPPASSPWLKVATVFGSVGVLLFLITLGVYAYVETSRPAGHLAVDARAYLDAADELVREGKFDSALEMNQRAAAANKDDALVIRIARQKDAIERALTLARARTQLSSGQIDAALASLSRALEQNPSDPEILALFEDARQRAASGTPAPAAAAVTPTPAPAPPEPAPAPAPERPVATAARVEPTPAPAPAAAAEVAQPGRMTVSTNPPSLVFLGGALLGQSPVDVPDLAPGEYEVSTQLSGYEPQRMTVLVRAGQTARVELDLAPVAPAPAPAPEVVVEAAPAPAPAPAPVAAVPAPAPQAPKLPGARTLADNYAFNDLSGKIQSELDKVGIDPNLTRAVLQALELECTSKFEAGLHVTMDANKVYLFIADQSRQGVAKKDIAVNARKAFKAGTFE